MLSHQLFSLMIKIVAVVLTSEAVFKTANASFSEPNALAQTLWAVSCLMLIEGFFLLLWFAIDTDHKAPFALKAGRMVLLAASSLLLVTLSAGVYTGLPLLAVQLFFGMSISRSMLLMIRMHQQVKPAPQPDDKMRRICRRHARNKALRQIISAYNQANHRLESRYHAERTLLEANHKRAIQEVASYKKLLLEKAYAKDNLARGQMLAHSARQEQTILPQPEPRQEGEFI